MKVENLLIVGIILIVVGILAVRFSWDIACAISRYPWVYEDRLDFTGIVSIVAGGICVIIAFFNVIKKRNN